MSVTCPPSCIRGTPLWSLYDVTDSNPEFCLYDSVVSEFTDIAGFPVLYYRAKSKMDRLYGEDANQDYWPPVKTKLYYEPTNEPNIIDGFGLRSDETLEYSLIPKSNFDRDVGGSLEGVPLSLSAISGGSGYLPRESISTTGGSGQGLRVNIATTGGVVTRITINTFNKGFGYSVGDVVMIDGGGTSSTFTISSVGSKDVGPMPGDVIKTLWNNRNYEVVDIGAEQLIFQAKKLVWEFILRPFRFSEQSIAAEQIHRSSVGWTYVYIYPDGEFADVIYANGVESFEVPINTLDLNLEGLECGYKYKRNDDGSVDILQEEIVVEDVDDNETYQETEKPFKQVISKIYGDNEWLEIESTKIDDYSDVDSIMFSRSVLTPIAHGESMNSVVTQTDINGFGITNFSDNEGTSIPFEPRGQYIYIVVPVSYGAPSFYVNGMIITFEESTGSFIINNETIECRVYRSSYVLNSNVSVYAILEDY